MRTPGLALLFLLMLAAPAAAAFPDNSVVLLHSPTSIGQPELYTDQNSSLSVLGNASDLTLAVQGIDGSWLNMRFAAKAGSVLTTGVDKKSVMDVSGSRVDCVDTSSRYDVKDIATDASGAITRLQIVYDDYCAAGNALFGEVRFGEPAPPGGAVVTPSELRWPDSQFGATQAAAGFALLADDSREIDTFAVAGHDSEDFSASPPTVCGSCGPPPPLTSLEVDFVPHQSGPRSAGLDITDTTGIDYVVPLYGRTSR